jgi:hypothetical protein
MPHTTDPHERSMLDALQSALDTIAGYARVNHRADPWDQRAHFLELHRRVLVLMEGVTTAVAARHRSDAFHAEYTALAELAWSLPLLANLDPIDWDAELAGPDGGQR